jgi:hypothetical protein
VQIGRFRLANADVVAAMILGGWTVVMIAAARAV